MKQNTHPPYQEVLFVDSATGESFVCGTTLQPKETMQYQGKEYPVMKVPVSSFSHPFFTGAKQFIDTEGRVDKFQKRYSAKQATPPPPAPKPVKPLSKGKQAGKKSKTK